jgi:hypothetical protein
MKGEDTKLLFVAILAAVAIILAGFAIVVPEEIPCRSPRIHLRARNTAFFSFHSTTGSFLKPE